MSAQPSHSRVESDHSDSDSESDTDDDESSEDEGNARPQPAGNPTLAAVNEIMSVLDPAQFLSPEEFPRVSANAYPSRYSANSPCCKARLCRLLIAFSAYTRTLATAIASLVRDPADMNRLRTAANVGRGYWAVQVATNMRNRFTRIDQQLRMNMANPASGTPVPETVDAILALMTTLDRIRADYFTAMEPATRQRIMTLVVEVFQYLSDVSDRYPNVARPAYVGEGFQPETSLFWAFTTRHPVRMIQYFINFRGHYGALAARMRDMVNTAMGHIRTRRQDSPDRQLLTNVEAALTMLHQRGSLILTSSRRR